MNIRIPFIFQLLITAALFLFSSCGNVRNKPVPQYNFDISSPLTYRILGQMQLNLQAGLVKYDGGLTISADMKITAIETNQYGYRLKIEFNNTEIEGVDPGTTQLLLLGLEQQLSTMVPVNLSRTGVSSGNGSGIVFSSWSSLIFPLFDSPDMLWSGISNSSEFTINLQGNRNLDFIIRHYSRIISSDEKNLTITNQFNADLYEKPNGNIFITAGKEGGLEFNYYDDFNIPEGRLEKKSGVFKIYLNIPVSLEIFPMFLIADGKGSFDISYKGASNH